MTEPHPSPPEVQGTRGSRRFALGLLVIVVVALGVRVAFTLLVDPQVPEVSDAAAYHMLGENLAEGRGFIRPFDRTILGEIRPTAEYPPLLPAVLALAHLVGIASVDGQQLVLCVVGTATVAVIGLLGRRVGGDLVGLVAAGVAAVYPMLFQSDAILMPETPFALLVATTLLFAHRAAERRGLDDIALVGVTAGLAALTRAEGLLLVLFLVIPLSARVADLSWRRRATLCLVGLVAAALVVVPWTVRNAVRFDGALVPVSNNMGTALDGANCDRTYHGSQTGLWLYDCFGGFDLSEQDEAEAAAFHRDRGLRYVADNLGRLPTVLAIRQGRTWGLYDVGQQVTVESFEGRDRRWQEVGTRTYWLLVPFAVGGIIVLRRRRALMWPMLSTVVLVVVTTTVTYGNQRFRVAAEPAIVVLAATGAVALIDEARRRTGGRSRTEAAPVRSAAAPGGSAPSPPGR
ncbi:MAG TPA: glycosyltransferase family 39 protein [Acidimicrobiales bacterium]|nr:glycosyltransferase family 39 protein [Acidimicrobiales bacterium]